MSNLKFHQERFDEFHDKAMDASRRDNDTLREMYWRRSADHAAIISELVRREGSRYLTPSTLDVLNERRRQIVDEDISLEHDDEHIDGSIARGAAAYALWAGGVHPEQQKADSLLWPWEPETFKPKDARSALVKAGAMILAEIERLDRKS